MPLYTARRRAEQLEEAIQLIRKLWTEEEASFAGKYYKLANAPFAPKPVQKPHPPIMIGGTGEKLTLPIVAKYADMWNAGGIGLPGLEHKISVLAEQCRQIGRDCAEIEKSYLIPLFLREDPAEVETLLNQIPSVQTLTREQMRAIILAGDIASVKRQVQAYIDIGVTHLIIALRRPGFYDREGLRLFATQVMPHFRTNS